MKILETVRPTVHSCQCLVCDYHQLGHASTEMASEHALDTGHFVVILSVLSSVVRRSTPD